MEKDIKRIKEELKILKSNLILNEYDSNNYDLKLKTILFSFDALKILNILLKKEKISKKEVLDILNTKKLNIKEINFILKQLNLEIINEGEINEN